MIELRILLDPSHEDKDLFDDYALWLGKEVKGGLLEMKRSKDLENKLMDYDSTTSFLIEHLNSIPEKRRVFPIMIYVLDYVREKNLKFWMAGLGEENMKYNIRGIISENTFEDGIYFFVIGKYHETFVKEDLEPIFAQKFDKVTYYKSSS